MREWLDNIAGPQYASAIMWTVGALVVLIVLLFLIRIVRGVSSGTFVAGGRNRRARLAVMDATAVDNQRRLVLVRRDNVEHLILIGGPNDIVVEQNIVPSAALQTPPSSTGEPLVRTAPPSVPQAEVAAGERPRAERREHTDPVIAPEPMPEPMVEIPNRKPVEPEAARPERRDEVNAPERQEPIAVVASAPVSSNVQQGTLAEPAARSGSVHFLDRSRIGPMYRDVVVQPVSFAAPEIRVAEPAGVAPQMVRMEPSIETGKAEPQADLESALTEELKAPLVDEPVSTPAEEPSLEDEMRRLLGELSAPARK